MAPAALWPQLGILVPEHRSATAYGLMTMVQSVALSLVPWLKRGALRDITAGYTASMLLFAGFGLVSTLVALLRTRPWRRGFRRLWPRSSRGCPVGRPRQVPLRSLERAIVEQRDAAVAGPRHGDIG